MPAYTPILTQLHAAARWDQVHQDIQHALAPLDGMPWVRALEQVHRDLAQPGSPFAQEVPFHAGAFDVGAEEKFALAKLIHNKPTLADDERKRALASVGQCAHPSEAMKAHANRWEHYKAQADKASVAHIEQMTTVALRTDPVGYAKLCDSGLPFGSAYSQALSELGSGRVHLLRRNSR